MSWRTVRLAFPANSLSSSADRSTSAYDAFRGLDAVGWQRLQSNLDRVAGLAAQRGIRAVLHPHVGTVIEKPEEVEQVLDGSWISLCLDTGHLLIGGTDPAELARQAAARIAHLHLKGRRLHPRGHVQSGRLTYTEAVGRGMYRPLGTGDVDVPAIVGHLRSQGYDGWYTLEQDTILTEEPTDEGPIVDVRASLHYLRTVLDA